MLFWVIQFPFEGWGKEIICSLSNNDGTAMSLGPLTEQGKWEGLVYITPIGSTTRPVQSVSDVKMSAMASQIKGVSIVCSTVGSGADQTKHQSSASLAFVWEIHRWPVNSRTKCRWRGKRFHLMASSCQWHYKKLRRITLIPFVNIKRHYGQHILC